MSSIPVTVIVAARNEAVNLPKCLASLKPAERVIVVDSKSTDGTSAIARSLGADVLMYEYKGSYPKKRQWVLDSGEVRTPWVLLIDADEEVTPELWAELRTAITGPQPCAAYLITKSYHFLGKRFRFGGFSFAAVLLFQTGKARFENTLAESTSDLDMEVHERIIVEGKTGKLNAVVLHNDFKGLQAYVDRHNRYSTWEAELRARFLETNSYGEQELRPRLFGNTQEFRRALKRVIIQLPMEPTLWWGYHVIFRLGFLEGRRGLIAGRIRANYIKDVRAKLYERQLKQRKAKP